MKTFSTQRATLLVIALSSLLIGCSTKSTDRKVGTETAQHSPDLPPQPPTAADNTAPSAPEPNNIPPAPPPNPVAPPPPPAAVNTAPSAPQPNIPPPAPPKPVAPPPEPIIVPGGTSLVVTVDQPLSSKTSQAGQTFLATVAHPVTVHGKNAIPKGSSVAGNVVAAKAKGKIKGEGELSLELTSIVISGKNYPIHTSTFSSTAKGKGKRTAKTTGGGAAGGALIGGIAGGGKGAGIGALVGAGAGLVGGAVTGNNQVEISSESPLTFKLSQPLTLPPDQNR
jgi:hypothetical protein